MYLHKLLSEKNQTIKKLSPKELAENIGTSYSNILEHRKQIQATCLTFKETTSPSGKKLARFTVDNLPSEIEAIKKILFQNELLAGEITTSMIRKRTNRSINRILDHKEEIKMLCPSYREVLINGNKTFVINENDLPLIPIIIPERKTTRARHIPPPKTARQLNEEAKLKRE